MLPGVIVGSIGCALLAAWGLYRLYQYYVFHRRVYSARAWPATAGTVVDGSTGYTPGMRGGRYYYARLNYRYQVQGHEYTGALQKHSILGEGQAKRLLEKYPPESFLQIHYNPVKPAEHLSTLDKSRTYLVVSLIIFLIGVLGVISAFAAVGS
jgi:hypothetical protein